MNIRTVAAVLLLAFAPIAGAARPAFAQSAEDPTLKAARQRFQEGVDYYDKGQYENARAAFLQAYALRKHPAVLLNLAQSSLKAGHPLEAARYFQQFLHDSTSISPAQRSDAERGLADSRKQVGRIEVSAATGADVTVDGDRIGIAPLTDPVDVEPGTHKVTVRSSDGTTDSRTVSVGAGQLASARFSTGNTSTVPPIGTPPPTTGGETNPPGGGETPGNPPADKGTTTNTAPPPASAEKKTNPLAPPQTMAPVWIGVGLGAAGFATAIAFAIAKSSAQSSATSVANEIEQAGGHSGTCANPVQRFALACSTLADDNNKVNTDALIANIGLAVGITGAALAVGWYLFAPKRDAGAAPTQGAATATVTPLVGPHLGGLSVGGSF
jgi:hypothetical protein